MKVFISSLIGGFERERAAARRAVSTLRHEPVMAEDFGAQPSSPQVACLNGLRGSDIVVLILGERYGSIPAGSTISATHQEYREARGTKPVIAFVQQGVTPEPEQAAFIDEVQAWEGGLFRGGFTTPDGLQDGITRALHDYTLSVAVGPVDEQEMAARATGLIPPEDSNHVSSTFLDIAIVGGPAQRVLRPGDMEAQQLVEDLQQSAMFGDHRLFDRTRGSESGLVGSDLVVRQDRGASVRLTEQGSIVIRVPLGEPQSGRGSMSGMAAMMVIVEEDVQQRLGTALGYATALLDRVDPTQRLTRVAIAARIAGADHRAWRTRAQNAASPNSVQIGHMGKQDRSPIVVNVARAALRLDRSSLIADLVVPLRRQFPAG
jgi:hypothetical protein